MNAILASHWRSAEARMRAHPVMLCIQNAIELDFNGQRVAGLDCARAWTAGFVRWNNLDHRHNGIRYVSPAQRYAGDDHVILAARHDLYCRARELNLARWSGTTRNGSPIGPVTLNPERDSIIKSHSAGSDIQPLAA